MRTIALAFLACGALTLVGADGACQDSSSEAYALGEQGEKLTECLMKRCGRADSILARLEVTRDALYAAQQDDRASFVPVTIVDYLLRSVASDISLGRTAQAALTANQLTAAALQGREFENPEDRDVEWLDYLGREIILLGRAGGPADESLAARRIATAQEAGSGLDRLRQDLLPRDFHLIDELSAVLRGFEATRSPDARIVRAESMLRLVDELDEALARGGRRRRLRFWRGELRRVVKGR